MQIVITVKPGATNADMARELRWKANLLDGIDPKKAASKALCESPLKKKGKAADEDEEVEETEDEETDADADEETEDDEESEESEDEETEDDEESEESEDEETEDEEKPAGKSKAALEKERKAVNAALKARAEKTSFKKAKAWLKAKFKVESINDLKPAQFPKVIKLAKVLN